MAPTPPPFRGERYELAAPGGYWLSPVRAEEAAGLGALFAGIAPWTRYQPGAATLTTLFTPAADNAIRMTPRTDAGEPAGILVLRQPWLAGPYVQFLAVAPQHQGRGLGAAMLAWCEAEARAAGQRNLWICAATFNEGAERLYRRFGFEAVAMLEDLLKDGFHETFMRKRLA